MSVVLLLCQLAYGSKIGLSDLGLSWKNNSDSLETVRDCFLVRVSGWCWYWLQTVGWSTVALLILVRMCKKHPILFFKRTIGGLVLQIMEQIMGSMLLATSIELPYLGPVVKERRRFWPLRNAYPAGWMLSSYVMMTPYAVSVILCFAGAKKWRSKTSEDDEKKREKRIEYICIVLLRTFATLCRETWIEFYDWVKYCAVMWCKMISILCRFGELNCAQRRNIGMMCRCVVVMFLLAVPEGCNKGMELVWPKKESICVSRYTESTYSECWKHISWKICKEVEFAKFEAEFDFMAHRQSLFFWDDKIPIYVVKPDNRTVLIMIRRNATVEMLYDATVDLLYDELCIALDDDWEASEISLSFGGKMLEMRLRIADYNIQAESTIFATFGLPGGGKASKDRREYFKNRRMKMKNWKLRAEQKKRDKRKTEQKAAETKEAKERRLAENKSRVRKHREKERNKKLEESKRLDGKDLNIKDFLDKSDDYYNRFVDDPIRAAYLLHENAGHARMGGMLRSLHDVRVVFGGDENPMNDEETMKLLCDKLCQEIESEGFNDEAGSELLRAMAAEYRRRHCCGMGLVTCASCGIRRFQREKHQYHHVKVADLPPCFFLSDEENENMDDLEKKTATIARKNDEGIILFETVRIGLICSVYTARCNQMRYHLHPEFIEDCDDGSEIVQFCDSCYKTGVRDKKAPPMSLAAGVDFGCADRLKLEMPNDHEQGIISLYRRFMRTVHLEENSGKSMNYTGAKLKSHLVMFRHDAPYVAADALKKTFIDVEKLRETMLVVFLGPDAKIDSMRVKAKEDTSLFARPYVLHQWFSVLKAVHPEFRELELPSYEMVERLVNNSIRELIEDADAVTDEAMIRLQEKIGSDVASARITDEFRVRQELRAGMMGVSRGAASTTTATYMTTNRLERDDDDAEDNGVYLEAFRDAIGRSKARNHGNRDKTSKKWWGLLDEWLCSGEEREVDFEDALHGQHKGDVLHSIREDGPIDEFVKDDRYITGAFPTTFVLGRAYGGGVSVIDAKQRVHLLHQFTCSAARDRGLQAYLFDHQKRMETIRGVSACISSHKGSMKKLEEIVDDDEEFNSKLQTAIKHPAGKIAKSLLRVVMPLLTFAGRKSSYGALERKAAISRILALCQRYGPGFIFLTLSSNDLNNPLSYRLTFRAKNNTAFPATVDAENFLEHMREETDFLGEGNVVVPCNYTERAMAAMDNPVAYVSEFREGYYDIVSLLLGKPLSLPSQDGMTGSTVRNSNFYAKIVEGGGVLENRKSKGLFGTNLSTYAVFEDHSKGTLHAHLIIFGGIPARVLQGAAAIPRLCQAVEKCLDSMISAEVPSEYHYQNAMLQVMREYNVPEDEFPLAPTSLMLESASLESNNHDYRDAIGDVGNKEAVFRAVCPHCSKVQRHRHCDTCTKGLMGCTGCRLCKPSNLKDKTGATWIVPRETLDPDTGKVINIEPEERSLKDLSWKDAIDHLIGSAFSEDHIPLLKKDRKLIVYEMQRRELPSLPEVVEEFESGDECSFQSCEEKPEIDDETIEMERILEEVAGRERKILVPFLKWFESNPLKVRRRVYQYISQLCVQGNGYITEYSPVLSLLTANHTAAYPLGGGEQALAAMFYLTGYVAKNKFDKERSLVVLKAAKDHLDRHPSTADDSGTAMRTARHLLQRTLNRFNLMMEVSDYQIAAGLIDLPTEVCTDTFAYTNPRYHLALIDYNQRSSKLNLSEFDRELEEMEENAVDTNFNDECSESVENYEHDDDDDDDQKCRHGIQRNLYDILGPAPFYVVDKLGATIPVPYPLHYYFRGRELDLLNRQEYYSCVKLVKIDSNKGKVSTKGKKKKGRPPSRRFRFHPDHPLYKTHEQYLVSKQFVLVLSDLPNHPGDFPLDESNEEEWHKTAAAFAKYYLCMFRPETIGMSYSYDWNALVSFVEELENGDSALGRLRLRAMESMIHSNSSSYTFKRCLQIYRAKSRTLWNEEERRRISFNRYSEAERTSSDFDQLNEDEYELRHRIISDQVLDRMHSDIRYSDSLLREFVAKCSFNADTRSNEASESSQSARWLHTRRVATALRNMDNGNYGIDTSALLSSSHSWYRKRKRVRDGLKKSQRRAVEMARQILRETNQHPSRRDKKAVDNIQLITGPAGTGKSYVIRCIQDMAEESGRPHNSFANNAINAIHIAGSTIDSVFHPPPLKKNQTEDDCHGCAPLDTDQVQRLKAKLRVCDNPIIVIDEISNVSPMKLVLVDMRLKQLMNNSNEPFGGLAVFLVGDFKQCGPVGGTVVAKAAIDIAEYDRAMKQMKKASSVVVGKSSKEKRKESARKNRKTRYSETSNYRQSAQLLSKVKWCHLIEQQRNKDIRHQNLLDKFEAGEVITLKSLLGNEDDEDELYKRLSPEDFLDKEEGWHKAPVLVSTHRERYTLTHFLAVNFAACENEMVYRWRSQSKKWMGKPSEIFLQDCINADPAFWEYYVRGAPVYVTDNIYKEIGLVNGTKATFHSLTFSSDDQIREERDAIQRRARVVNLSSPPKTVNIELESPFDHSDPRHLQWIRKYSKITLVSGRVVIPISTKRHKRDQWKNTVIRGQHGRWRPCRVYLKRHFPLMPGFAITIHKAQGMTLKKVILAVGSRPGQFNLKYNSLYVAFSRVETADNIRLLLPIGSNWSELFYISKLQPDPAVASYFAGFRSNVDINNKNRWSAAMALKHYDKQIKAYEKNGFHVKKRRLPRKVVHSKKKRKSSDA